MRRHSSGSRQERSMVENIVEVEYRHVPFSEYGFQSPLFTDRCPVWAVYAGNNGSIMAYKPDTGWELLGQTQKDGYWQVTLVDRYKLRAQKAKMVPDRPQYPVYILVLLAWKGIPE